MAEPFRASAGGSGGITPDQKKTATASEALSQLSIGTTYTGKIVEVSATNTYTVRLDSPAGANVSGVVLASAIVSGILGFQDSRVLGVGTPVGMAYGSPSFIFAVFPSAQPDKKNGANRSVAWGDPVNRTNDAGRFASTNVAEDLVASEFDFDNLFGVGIRFLTGLVAMKAGDRAKVECHLYNDMVRIVSQQFRHIHGLGEDLIFDHGRPTMERGYTSYRHELMGKELETEPLFNLNGDEVDKKSLERVEKQARHRYLEYMGFVGDFIHRFVCDPPTTLVSLADGKLGVAFAGAADPTGASGRRAGKFWEHIGSDGSYMLHTCAEIRFERVTKIPVFHRKASHESNATTKARRYRELKRDFVKAWDYGSYDAKNAYRTAYQLRLYARWLTRYQAFARALQLDSEYAMQSEQASPTPDWNNVEEDRRATNPDLAYYESYSSYSILRDGSQVIHDGYGSSAVFSNGNIQLSAARHIDLEAAGDVRVSCDSFFLKARRHIELSASAGGIIFHSFALLRMLCEKGSIHIRSDAKPPGALAPDGPKSLVTPPIQPVVLDSAILLESAEGKTAIRSFKQVSVTVDGTPADADGRDTDECDIILSTKGSIRGKAQKYIILGAAKDIITACRNWAVKVSKWYGDVGEIMWDKFYLRPKAGNIQIRRLEVQSMVAQGSILAPYRGPVPLPNARYTGGQHGNHIGVRTRDIVWKDTSEKDVEAQASLEFAPDAKTKPVSPWEKDAEDAKWEFFSPTDYYWDKRDERKGALVQTLTQQYLEHDEPTHLWGGVPLAPNDSHYDIWSWSSDRLQISKRTGDNRVGFGGVAQQFKESAGQNLHQASPLSGADLGANSSASSWSTNSVFMRILKHT